MISHTDIKKIIDAGVQAPSGENCQPWKFVVKGNQIDVFNLPDRDQSLYNFCQLGSYVAHGALIENIVIASNQFGYRPTVSVFPDKNNTTHVSTIFFENSIPNDDSLFEFIFKRSSNRRSYNANKLQENQKDELLKAANEVGKGTVILVDEIEKKREIARNLVVSDQMLFENRKIHDFLFSHIVWNKSEAEEKKSGFYIKELALPIPVEKIFKILRDWNKVLLFNKFGFSKLAARGNIKLYSKVGALGAVIMEGNSPADFLVAGRILQRLWLKATKMELNIQPVTGVLFFMQRIIGNAAEDFSEEHIQLVREAYKTIVDVFGISNNGTIAMIFRIGYSNTKPTKSLRLPPDITFAQ